MFESTECYPYYQKRQNRVPTRYTNEDCQGKAYKENHKDEDKMPLGQGVEAHRGQPARDRGRNIRN